jgi:nitrous oxidase accessory protein NosD
VLHVTAISATLRVPADCPSIQKAIERADHGDMILVDRGTYIENLNFLGKAITVKSTEGPHFTSIDGGQKGSVVTFSTWEGEKSVLEGFTITNGTGSAIAYYNETYTCGGGILCHAFTAPTIRNNIVRDNKADHWGGGIFCHMKASPKIRNNVLCDNKAQNGGAIYCLRESAPFIVENAVYTNEAEIGGAVYCDEACYATIRHNYVGENSAGEGYDAIEGTVTTSSVLENSLE